jgi:N6-L-threonylcarbamoyladenine synthase
MLLLGIESSCDETSAALVEDGKVIRSNVIFSQADIHAKWQGVVPEIASRNHLSKIAGVTREALGGLSVRDVDAVAVTRGPGLVGALLVGFSFAKAAAWAAGKPLVPVDHIRGHMYAPHLFEDIAFPYVGLVVSGGHTLLFLVNSFTDMRLLGSTIDDAAGEAFDKVAKLLGLGYPGGPLIDRAAKNGDPKAFDLPLGLSDKEGDRCNFSYSGLKTAVAYRLRGLELDKKTVNDVAASFQRAAVELLVRKTRNALRDNGIQRLVVSGGVAANGYLRRRFDEMRHEGVEVHTAPVAYCGDNAAMVAGRGYHDFLAGERAGLDAEVYSRLSFLSRGKRPEVQLPRETFI